jgi:predicted transcriptional regulator
MTTLPRPTQAELDLLRVLWRTGPATVKQVHHEVLKERDVAYAAVLRLMQVMHTKGILLRDEGQRAHVYRPAHKQVALQKRLLRDLIQKAFSGSGRDLVLAALRGGHVTPEERREIQTFLDTTEGTR